ncbi:hypothetical protein BC829DRAFT_422214 [Chytridium lagenaria]|nr:hypothetical protein BC829DRAFT_422214 [Chytridium lagenaria]
MSSIVFTALTWVLLATTAFTAPVPQSNIPEKASNELNNVKLTLGGGLTGALSILVGGFILFFGFKLYKPTIFVVGSIIGSMLGYNILIRVEPSNGYPSRELVLLLGSIAIGILFGFLLLCLRRLCIFALGAVGGFFLAIFILGLRPGSLIESGWGRWIFIAVFVIIGIVAALKLEKPLVIFVTSFAGSYGVIFGVDCFAGVGFAEAAARAVAGGNVDVSAFQVDGKVIAMAISVLVLTAIGVVVQYRINRGRLQWIQDSKK